MAASAEPPAYCFGYGGFSQLFVTTMPPSIITPSCNTQTSISPPSSPSSSHSSLSLEPLTSSPSSSSLAGTFSYHHLLSPSYTHIPTLLDTPSSHYSPLSLSKPISHPTIKKRLAMCELAHPAQLEDDPMGPKRLCETAVASDGRRVYICRESSSSYANHPELPSDSTHPELVDGAISRHDSADNAGLIAGGGDLDDMLDLLLQEADEAVPTAIADQSSLAGGNGGRSSVGFSYSLLNQCKEEVKEVVCNWKPWKDEDKDEVESSGGTAWRRRTGAGEWSEGGQKGLLAAGTEREALKEVVRGKEGMRRSRWAGPTLLDIESALATMSGSPPSPLYPPLSSLFGLPPPTSPYLCPIRDILQQETSSYFLTCKEEEGGDNNICTWRRLQKRSHMEPRYTVKIRCEEDAANDGHRWRKYGQKSIKNSPYPRSYYRCSSGKCNVKKQVERCGDAGLLVVTYEGIHLHHRPTSIPTHVCSPPPPTCKPSPSLPTSHTTNIIATSPLLSHLLSSPLSHTSFPS